MRFLKKHVIVSAFGLVLGLLALAWLRPDNSGGTTLVLLLIVTVLNAVALLIPLRPNSTTKAPTKKKRQSKK
jgi:hypothetical protein